MNPILNHPLKGKKSMYYCLHFITPFKRCLTCVIVLLFMLATGKSLLAQTTIFSQNFSSSTSVASYISGTPNSGQFDDTAIAGSNTISINSGALRFTRGNNIGSFTRSTNFSPTPTAIVYSFTINVSSTGSNQNSAATFQVGSNYTNTNNNVETNANTYAQFAIDFRGGGSNFRLRDITNNNTGTSYSTGTTYTITWAMNNSGSSRSYTAPDGTTETLANDRMDIWVGTSQEFEDVNIQTAGGSLTDLKFAFLAGTGNIDLDNFNIYSINPFITAQPSSIARCIGASASFSVTASGTSLSYQWKKGGTNLSNGGNISGATSSTLTINPVAAGDAASDYTVDVTSSGGYTASSNNASLTVNNLPTITASAAATNVCYSSSSQNSGLSYSATTNSPTTYTITWDAGALAAGLVNVGSTALPASPITVPVAAGIAAGTYTGTLAVTNGNGCISTGSSFTLTVVPPPTIGGTLDACVGGTTQLTGSGTAASSSPWVSASTGVATVNSTGLVSGVSGGTSVITYTDNIGCSNTTTVTINTPPTVTGVSVCPGGSGSLVFNTTCSGGSSVSSGATNAGTGSNNTAVGTGAWTSPGNITATGTPYATQNLASGATTNYLQASNYGFSIPSNATINGITVVIRRQASSNGNMFDNIVRLVKGGTVIGSNLASGTAWTNSFVAASYGGSSSLWGTTWTASDINSSNFGVVLSVLSSSGLTRQLDVDYIQVTITYTTSGSLNWYTVSSGGSSIGTTTPFNPVGVAGSGLANTNTPGTTTFYAECAALPGCRGAANFVINPLPTITTSAAAASVCYSSSSQNSGLSYSATTNTPTTYTITWDAAALAAGFVNVGSTALPASPVTVPVAAGIAPGTYTGTLAVTNGNGCTSTGNSFTITINSLPAIGGTLSACVGATTQLNGSGTPASSSPWVSATTSVATINSTGLVTGVSGGTSVITYTDNIGCSNTATVTISAPPTVSGASVCVGGSGSLTSSTTCSGGVSSSSGPNNAGTGSNNTAIGTGVWTSPGNITTAGTPYATQNLASGATTNYLHASNYGFSIPAGATINGITVAIRRVASGPNSQFDNVVRLVKGGIVTGSNLASGTAWATSFVAASYGGSSNLWGSTWTASDINSSNFGVVLSVTSSSGGTRTLDVDYIQVTVHYTTSTLNWYTVSSGGSSIGVGTPFDPVGVVGSGLLNTNTPGTTTYYAECAAIPGCRSTANYVITNAVPVMTSATSATICTGGTVSIPLTSDIASTYEWVAASNTNVTGESTTTQTTSTLSNTLTLTSGVAQVVNYTVTPTSTGGCTGTSQAVAVTVNLLPTVTSSATATTKCYSTSSQVTTLSYSATTGSPTLYSITWNAAAQSAGLVNVSNATLGSSPITIPVAAGVAAGTYTGTLTVGTSVSGCTSAGNSFTFTINATPVITTQPTDQTACIGSSASFSITVSGTSLTYQWRKGTTNLVNGGTISGATSSTLTISSVAGGDAATDYNCVVTRTPCASVISDYVSLTTNTSASAPTAQPTLLVFPSVNTTSILGTYVLSASASYYLVIRKTVNVTPTAPSNGTTYTQGSSALTGYIDYVGASNTFTSNGLSPNTTYYYWVYAYNTSSCGTSPVYYTTSPLTGNATTATTVSCGTVTTLYWSGQGSGITGHTNGTDFNTASNWSLSNLLHIASPVAPTQCNTVSMATTSSATITLSANASVYDLNYTITSNNATARLSTQGYTLTVNGDAVIDVLTSSSNTSISIGENSGGSGVVDFKANFKIGETYHSSGNVPQSYLIGNANSKITFRGDVTFGRSARFYLPGNVGYPPSYPLSSIGNGQTPGTIEFDGAGLQQVLWNNNVWYDCFYNIVVGNQNQPYVKHVTGTYTPDNILNNFTINNGATVDLATSQWIREQSGGTFTMNGTAKLILGNNQAVQSSQNTGVTVAGSNFPGGFATMNIASTATIEYNGSSSMTQTVYSTPTYGNLILSNGPTTGTANKVSTGTITVSGATTVSDKTLFTPGANFVSNGAATINSGGRINCGTYTISGSGSFTVASGGTLGIGSTNGITASCACGNVQTTTRTFGTGGNYVYYGSSAQPTGDGLPRTMNNLTISNASGVTMYAASANYTVAGTLTLTSGALAINGDSLTINSLQRTSGTLTGSATSSVGITGTNVPLFFTSGGRTLKNLFLNSNASANLQTALDITAGSSAGSVAVASGATLTTYGNLTLKSDANGTARIAQIPVNGSGVALGTISGTVQVERYIPAKRGWRMMAMPVSSAGAPTINEAWQEGVVNTDYVYANNLNPSPGFGLHISGSSSSLGFDPTPLNNPSLMVYNNSTSTWSGIPNTLSTLVSDYPGYMLFVRGNRSVNVSLNPLATPSNTVLRVLGNINSGRQTLNVSAGAGNYAVAGNPYCSTIDFRNITSTGGVSTGSYVIWDPALTGSRGVGAYQYFTQTGGAGTDYTVFPGGGSYGAAYSVNNNIQSGQSFLVPKSSSSGTLVINESAKVSSSTSTVFRPFPNMKLGRIGTLMYAVDSDTSLTLLDGALSLYKNEFSDELDVEDVRKIKNISSETFGIKTRDEFIAIEKKKSLSESDTIVYNMRSIKLRNYQLSIDMSDINVAGLTAFLEDTYTKSKTELKLNATTFYPFTIIMDSGSFATNRFRIVFKQLPSVPVSFISINAVRNNKAINIEWKAENENDVEAYEVEKSANGTDFTKVYTENNVNNNGTYTWADESPVNGINYFRVKAITRDGKVQYTTIAKVLFTTNASITVFPNPVSGGRINMYFNNQAGGVYTIRLFNTTGQVIQSQKLKQPEGSSNNGINFNTQMPHANYTLEITKPDKTTEKINIVY